MALKQAFTLHLRGLCLLRETLRNFILLEIPRFWMDLATNGTKWSVIQLFNTDKWLEWRLLWTLRVWDLFIHGHFSKSICKAAVSWRLLLETKTPSSKRNPGKQRGERRARGDQALAPRLINFRCIQTVFISKNPGKYFTHPSLGLILLILSKIYMKLTFKFQKTRAIIFNFKDFSDL